MIYFPALLAVRSVGRLVNLISQPVPPIQVGVLPTYLLRVCPGGLLLSLCGHPTKFHPTRAHSSNGLFNGVPLGTLKNWEPGRHRPERSGEVGIPTPIE